MRALVLNCSPVKTGATAEIVRITAEELSGRYDTAAMCISDLSFGFCTGCRSCLIIGECFQKDDVDVLMGKFEKSDIIVFVSPSYWADVPAQFKAFIDRCTPWSNTHDPHAALSDGKKAYAVVLRTGPGMAECEKIIGTISHFCGHLDIEFCGGLGLCSVEYREDAEGRKDEITAFCRDI